MQDKQWLKIVSNTSNELVQDKQWLNNVSAVTSADVEEALKDSRATVTSQMEAEYKKMRGELKKRAVEVRPIGFIHEGMVESTRDAKHGDDKN